MDELCGASSGNPDQVSIRQGSQQSCWHAPVKAAGAILLLLAALTTGSLDQVPSTVRVMASMHKLQPARLVAAACLIGRQHDVPMQRHWLAFAS